MPDNKSDAARKLEEWLDTQQEAYNAHSEKLKVFVRHFEDELLSTARTAAGVIVRARGRLKSWKSLKPKLESGAAPSWDQCADLLAFKLIVLSSDMRGSVIDHVADYRRDGTQLQRYWHSSFGRGRGYSATHLQIELPQTFQIPDPLETYEIRSNLRKVGAELQILTELQEAWDTITHDNFYKTEDGVPIEMRHRVYRLAAGLDLLDQEMQEVRSSLKNVRDDIKKEFVTARTEDSDRWKQIALDEVGVKLSAEYQLKSDFEALYELGRECGLRESGWPELVRCDHELECILDIAEQLSLRKIGELKEYLDRAKSHKSQLKLIVKALKQKQGENHSLFNRPLYVLAIVLMLEHPGIPGARFSQVIAAEIRKVAANHNCQGEDNGE